MTITVTVTAFGRRNTHCTVVSAKQAKATSWNAAKQFRKGTVRKATPAAASSTQLHDCIDATMAQEAAERQAIAAQVEAAFQASLSELSK